MRKNSDTPVSVIRKMFINFPDHGLALFCSPYFKGSPKFPSIYQGIMIPDRFSSHFSGDWLPDRFEGITDTGVFYFFRPLIVLAAKIARTLLLSLTNFYSTYNILLLHADLSVSQKVLVPQVTCKGFEHSP